MHQFIEKTVKIKSRTHFATLLKGHPRGSIPSYPRGSIPSFESHAANRRGKKIKCQSRGVQNKITHQLKSRRKNNIPRVMGPVTQLDTL